MLSFDWILSLEKEKKDCPWLGLQAWRSKWLLVCQWTLNNALGESLQRSHHLNTTSCVRRDRHGPQSNDSWPCSSVHNDMVTMGPIRDLSYRGSKSFWSWHSSSRECSSKSSWLFKLPDFAKWAEKSRFSTSTVCLMTLGSTHKLADRCQSSSVLTKDVWNDSWCVEIAPITSEEKNQRHDQKEMRSWWRHTDKAKTISSLPSSIIRLATGPRRISQVVCNEHVNHPTALRIINATLCAKLRLS